MQKQLSDLACGKAMHSNVGVSASMMESHVRVSACVVLELETSLSIALHLVKLLRSSMTQDARDVLSHELMSPCW